MAWARAPRPISTTTQVAMTTSRWRKHHLAMADMNLLFAFVGLWRTPSLESRSRSYLGDERVPAWGTARLGRGGGVGASRELFEPPGQEPPLGGRGGQAERLAVRRPRLGAAAETPQQLAAGGVEVEVAVQVEAVHGVQRRGGVAGLGEGRGVVELDHRGAGEFGQPPVQLGDLRPVDLLGGLQRRDRGLDDVGAAAAQRDRLVERRPSRSYLGVVPQRTVLIFEEHQILAREPG